MQAGALTSVGSFVAGAAGGFGSALIASNGNLDAGLKGAISGGAFALAGDVGQAYGAYGGEHFAAHAAAGCLQGELGGGGCGRGALSGMAGLEGSRYGPIGAVVAGGTASVIGGGKFGNGAVTGAFGYLFNYCSHDGNCTTKLEQALWDYMPGYQVGTRIKNGDCTGADWARATGGTALAVVGVIEVRGAGAAAVRFPRFFVFQRAGFMLPVFPVAEPTSSPARTGLATCSRGSSGGVSGCRRPQCIRMPRPSSLPAWRSAHHAPARS